MKGIQGLGMLQHLRDSRLIPYRTGCNCLYEHPGLKHLLVGRQGRYAIDSYIIQYSERRCQLLELGSPSSLVGNHLSHQRL